MKNPIKFVKLNGLQYNPNRDPQVYRRLPKQPFDVEAHLIGSGTVTVRFSVDNKVVCERSIPLPGRFECEVAFDTPASRIGLLSVEHGTEKFQQSLRLDVLDHAWIG